MQEFDSYEAASKILDRFHLPWAPSSIALLAEELDRIYVLARAAQCERDARFLEHIANELRWTAIKSHEDKFTWQANALSDAAAHLRDGHSICAQSE